MGGYLGMAFQNFREVLRFLPGMGSPEIHQVGDDELQTSAIAYRLVRFSMRFTQKHMINLAFPPIIMIPSF